MRRGMGEERGGSGSITTGAELAICEGTRSAVGVETAASETCCVANERSCDSARFAGMQCCTQTADCRAGIGAGVE